MSRKIKLLLAILVVGIGIGVWIWQRPTTIAPYPYRFTSSPQLPPSEISDADVLILGDRMGKYLDSYLESWQQKVSINLSTPMKIVNWSQEQEGLHRTLQKLKFLSHAPNLIFYSGGSEEYLEQKFKLGEFPTLNKNIQRYQSPWFQSILLLFPWLSKIIYLPMDLVTLGPRITPDTFPYGPAEIFQKAEIGQKLFSFELQELINWSKDRDSKLVFITTPYNLEIPPQQVCPHTISDEIRDKHSMIKNLITEGDYKTAYNLLKILAVDHPGNAATFFLLGTVAKFLERQDEALFFLKKASAFDCQLWRGNFVFNSIMKKLASEQGIEIIDFDQMLMNQFGKNTLFFNEIYPQDLFYQDLTEELARVTKQVFAL